MKTSKEKVVIGHNPSDEKRTPFSSYSYEKETEERDERDIQATWAEFEREFWARFLKESCQIGIGIPIRLGS